jgi:hypothetical protein
MVEVKVVPIALRDWAVVVGNDIVAIYPLKPMAERAANEARLRLAFGKMGEGEEGE